MRKTLTPSIAGRQVQPARRRRMGLRRREAIAGVLFALPAVLGFLFWWLGPMVASAVISLTDWQIITPPHWIGLANYVGAISPSHPIPALINDPLFWTSLRVTATYALLAVPLSLVTSFCIAMALNQPIRMVGLFRSIYYLPSILPAVASALAWLWLYNPEFGLFNTALDWAALPTSPWLSSERTVIPSLVVLSVWGSGGLMIIFLAALKGVPRHLYEAAAMDGAGAPRRLWHITLPSVSPVILFNLVTSLIGTFAAGIVQAQFMTGGGPNNGSLFFAFYLYRTAFQDGYMGYATAMSWALFLLLLVLTLLILWVARTRVYYEESGAA